MSLRRVSRLSIYGGVVGLILGALVVLGIIMVVHIGRGQGGEGRKDPDAMSDGQIAEAEDSPPEPQSDKPSTPEATGAENLRFPTTWGTLERIASAQLEWGDEAGAFKTLALIPADEEGRKPVYRTGRARAYNVLLTQAMRRDPPAPHKRRAAAAAGEIADRLAQAEKIIGKMSVGLARANGWMKIAEHVRNVKGREAARPYLDKAVAEAAKSPASGDCDDGLGGELRQAWRRVGGWLILLWPVGLTALGSIGAEMGRRAFEAVLDDFGYSIARGLGNDQKADNLHRHFGRHEGELTPRPSLSEQEESLAEMPASQPDTTGLISRR